MSNEMYLNFIEETLETEGIEIADTANKIALEQKKITTAQYSAAARLIVKAYLDRE